MGDVNWNLGLAQTNPGEQFANAFAQAQHQQQVNAAKNALAGLVQNPNDPQALGALAKVDPATAMQFRSQQAQLVKQQLGEHADSVVKGAEIFRTVKANNPGLPDEQIWQMTLPALAQAGIPMQEIPTSYNPQYVQNALAIADALKPQSSDTQIVPIPAGGSALQYNRTTHQLEPLIVPNPGGIAPGTPVSGGGMPHVSSPAEASKLPPGTQFVMPDGRIGTVPGGAGGNASGGFPGPRY